MYVKLPPNLAFNQYPELLIIIYPIEKVNSNNFRVVNNGCALFKYNF